MSGGLYNTSNKKFDTTLNLKELRPYGDTMNDGKVQMSFTLLFTAALCIPLTMKTSMCRPLKRKP